MKIPPSINVRDGFFILISQLQYNHDNRLLLYTSHTLNYRLPTVMSLLPVVASLPDQMICPEMSKFLRKRLKLSKQVITKITDDNKITTHFFLL